jgi:hypothetical protein
MWPRTYAPVSSIRKPVIFAPIAIFSPRAAKKTPVCPPSGDKPFFRHFVLLAMDKIGNSCYKLVLIRRK